MDGEAPVHSWSCSYYVDGDKRWVSGRLTLTQRAVHFSSSSSSSGGGARGAFLLLPLSRVTHINTESSCFIFSAVTLQERDAPHKHWFSSLKPSAGAVFHVLQHFWKETLVPHTHSSHTPLSRGQRLIGMVSDTQHTLSHTGRALSQQGEQFHHMINQLEKMESDLGVADKLLWELESPAWWPFGKLPWSRRCQVEALPPEGSSKPSKEILSVPVVFYRGGDLNAADVNSGTLVLLVSSLEVRDATGRLVYSFHKQEVDEIRVHGVCDVSVRQRHIGKPDVCFRFLSAKMAEALCVLEAQYKKKVEFARDYSGFQATPGDDITTGSGALWGAGASLDSAVPVQLAAGDLTPVQLHVQQNTVSQEEAQELKQMLLQLKSLALEADSELQRQDESLDVLMSSSERNTMTIDTHTRRMRKLL